MSSIAQFPLRELAKLNPAFKSASTLADERVDFLPMSGVNAEYSIAAAAETRPFSEVQKGYTNFSDGDVLLAKITPCFENGKIAQVRLKNRLGFGSTEFHVLRPDSERLDSRYLVHFLRRDEIRVDGERNMTGSAGQRRVPRHFIESLLIPLPALPEQRRIAAILDQADALRAKRREALAQMDILTQSIFIEMFGDPATNSKNWKTRPLLEGCDEINDCPHSTPAWTDGGQVCLRTSNLTEGGWNWSDTRYVSETTFHERSKRGYVAAGDIVLSREGTVGIAAVVTSGMKVCMGQRLVQVRPSPSFLTSEFLLRYLLFVLSPKRIGQLMVGSTSQHLNVKELKALLIPLPPVALQLEFSRISATLERLKKTTKNSLSELDSLFATLQHRAFRGEL